MSWIWEGLALWFAIQLFVFCGLWALVGWRLNRNWSDEKLFSDYD